MPKVWNKRHKNVPKDAVYVGRPSIWGNPYEIDHSDITKTRELVIEAHKKYFIRNDFLVRKAKTELKGKDLVCWCAPKPCHADILLEIANA